MKKEITIKNESGSIIGYTYIKRGNQLVKKGRAFWINNNIICIKDQIKKEAVKLDSSYDKSKSNGYRVMHDEEIINEDFKIIDRFYTDDELILLAKQQLIDKRNLFIHICTYLIVMFFSSIIYSMLNLNFFYEIFGFIAAAWAMGICFHILYFFIKITPLKVKKQYKKLKKRLYK